MQKKRFGKIVTFCAMMTTCLLLQKPVLANAGSITVDFSVENHTKGISGAEFTAVKILSYKDGMYTSVTDADVSEYDVLNNTEETAEKLASEFTNNDGRSLITNSNGKLTFDNLSDGVWLIFQTGNQNTSELYSKSSPSLVQIPVWEDGNLTDTLTIYPKTTTANGSGAMIDTDKTSKNTSDNNTSDKTSDTSASAKSSAKTGDTTVVDGWIICLTLSGIFIVTARFLQRRENS